MMGIPIGWTDPNLHDAFVTPVPWWFEPDVPRVARGVRYRADRLRGIGNSVVWPCAAYVLARSLAATPSLARGRHLVA